MLNQYGQSNYGQCVYGMNVESDQETLGYDFMPYLPWVYNVSGINTSKLLNSVIGIEYMNEMKYAKEVELQRHVASSTWGLERWEKELGLPTVAISSGVRRGRILSKLAGSERTTNKVLKELARDILDTTIDIDEHIEKFHTNIKITGLRGVPENATFFMDTLEEVMPAHLTYEVTYNLTTYGALNSPLKATHGEINDSKTEYGKMEEYRVKEIE